MLKVTYVGKGGIGMDSPCYKDQNGKYYFDVNEGNGTLNLYDGAYINEETKEIYGEPNRHIETEIVCDEPYQTPRYMLQYTMLSKLSIESKHYIDGLILKESDLYGGSIKACCEAMYKFYDQISEKDKPNWISKEQIHEYHSQMLKRR